MLMHIDNEFLSIFYIDGVLETMECFCQPNQKQKKILELNPCLTCGKWGWFGSDMADVFLRNK